MSALMPEKSRRLLAPVWPVLAMAGPLVLYSVLLGGLLDGLAPAPTKIDDFDLAVDTTTPAQSAAAAIAAKRTLPTPVVARELTARLEFGLAVLVFIIAAVASIAYAAAAIAARRGVVAGAGVLAIACFFGVMVFVSDTGVAVEIEAGGRLAWLTPLKPLLGNFSPGIQDDIRALVVTEARAAAEAAGLFSPDVGWHVVWLAALTSGIGVAATTALVLRFAEIALWAMEDEDEIDGLRERWRALRTTLIFGAVVLTLATIGTRVFYQWPVAMLDAPSAAALSAIAHTGAALWGTLFTLLLITTALPALMALHLEIDAAADGHAIDHGGRKSWREKHGLLLAPSQALSGALAAATPLLATPALEGLAMLFG